MRLCSEERVKFTQDDNKIHCLGRVNTLFCGQDLAFHHYLLLPVAFEITAISTVEFTE